MMKIKIPLNTVLEECKECPYFELEMDNVYAFNKVDTIIYKCKHIEACESAIKLFKKHMEVEKEEKNG